MGIQIGKSIFKNCFFYQVTHIYINSEPVVLLLNTHVKEVYVNEILKHVIVVVTWKQPYNQQREDG